MDRTYEWLKDEGETDFYEDVESLIKQNPWAWQSVCAVVGLAGGVIAPFLGAASDIISWFVISTTVNSYLHVLSIVFCALTIPLLALGACCLDMLEKQTGKSREINSDGATKAPSSKCHARLHVASIAVLLVLLCAIPSQTQAQQTVFNVPTTDVLDQGKVYFELDISAKPNNSEAVPRFSSFVPRVVVGAGGRVEFGLNVTGNIQPGADATTLVPTVKWKVYDGGDNGWAVAVGNNLFIPVRNKSYDLGTYSYTTIQKTFRSNTRVGFGGYFFSKNVVAADANRAGGQFTIEQPLNKKATLAADWLTGRHGAGYFTPGVIYKISPKVTGYASYSIGNQNPTRGNHFFLIEVGYNFN